MEKTKLSLSSIFKDSFLLAKRHFVVVLGLILGYIVVSLVLNVLSTNSSDVVNFVVGIVALVVSLLFILGLNRILLDATDGGEPAFSAFKQESGKAWALFLQQLAKGFLQLLAALPSVILFFVALFSVAGSELSLTIDDLAMYSEDEMLEVLITCIALMTPSTMMLALLLLLLPLYVTVRLMYAPFVLIDEEGSGAISSLRRSWAMTKGNVWILVALVVLVGLLNLLGLVALVVGLLFTLVVSSFVGAVSYRMLQAKGNDEQAD